MFETNDDIDDDDEFLNGVFDTEPVEFGNGFSSTADNFPNGLILRNGPQPALCPNGSATFGMPSFLNTPNCSKAIISDKKDSNSLSKNKHLLPDVNEHTPNSNKDNKRKLSSSPVPLRTKRERKFPGPAGLLPDRKTSRGTPIKLDSIIEADKSPPNSSPEELCSQGRCSGSVLEDEPWQTLLADLGPDRSILDVMNVANVKRKAAAKCFVGKKLPFLAAILHHLDVSSPDPCIILRDNTGEIHGTLHREVWDQFAGDLIVGSVLVVRNVGLLSTGLSSRRHYLNITANNLVTIYSASSDKSGRARLHPFSRPNFNQIIEHWRSLISPRGVGSPAPVGSPTLFNSSFSSPITSRPSPVTTFRNINSGGSLASRTEMNEKLIKVAQQNLRSNVAHNPQCSVPGTSGTAGLVHLRNAEKKLLPSFTQTSHQDPFNNTTVNKSLNRVIDSRLLNKINDTNLLHRKPVESPTVQSAMGSSNSDRVTKVNSCSNTFSFNPVIVKQKNSSNEIFSHYKSENKSNNKEQNVSINTLNCDANTSLGYNNSIIILSQTSELTAEEQSMVESVFDGIDADSLFDDDF